MGFVSFTKKRRSLGVTSSATMAEDLIPALWQQLPVELLYEVLSKLPVSALKKFTCVSKEWKALIESEGFARGYRRRDFTAFYFFCGDGYAYLALPNLKANLWEKHLLDLKTEDAYERWNPVDLVAADGGLLCYRFVTRGHVSETYEINLVVQNPVTRKSRRLLVPHHPETTVSMDSEAYGYQMLVGLAVDKETGSYKLVVTRIGDHLSSNCKTFLYDSLLRTWTTSAALSLVPALRFEYEVLLALHDEDELEIRRSIYWDGELLWLVKMAGFRTNGPDIIWLIKYNVQKDIWTVAMEQFPTTVDLHLNHNATENQVLLITSNRKRNSPQATPPPNYFPLLSLVPGMTLMKVEDVLGQAVSKIPAKFRPEHCQAVFGGGSWFITSEPYFDGGTHIGRWTADVFEYTNSLRRIARLPKLNSMHLDIELDTFEATFNAFV